MYKLSAISQTHSSRTGLATILAIALLGSLSTNHTWVAGAFVAAAALLGAVEMAQGRRIPREAWLLLLPFLYWTFSFLLSRESASVFFSMGFLRYDGALYVCLLPIAALAALPLDRNRLAAALLLYMALHAAIAVVGGIGALTGWHTAFYHPAELVDHQPTFFGLFKAHNATASVYVFLAVGAFAWALRPENTPRSQFVVLALTATLAFGCILARSRGAYLAMGAGMAFLVVLALRRQIPHRLKIGAVAALAVVIAVGTVMMVPRFVRAAGQGGDQARKEFWSRAVSDFKRSPVVGIGFGRYNDLNPHFTSIGIGEVATKADVYTDDRHAHNSYLHWLAEGGALGLAAMIVFWALVLRGVKGSGALRDWGVSGIVVMAVLSLTEHYAGGGVFLMHLSLIIGVNQSKSE